MGFYASAPLTGRSGHANIGTFMARHRPPTRWICPLCERSVPPDEPICYCGTSRAAVEAHLERERQRKARPFPWLVFLGELAVAALGLYWVLAPSATPVAVPPPRPAVIPATGPGETPTVATSSANASEPSPTLPPGPLARADERQPAPRAEPAMASNPKPALPARPERTETDLEREAGEKQLEQSLAKLGAVMAQLSENARQFEAICLGRRGEPRSCARLHDDVASASETLARGLEGAEDEARRASIPPGVVRDLRQKRGLEEGAWKDLEERVRRLTGQYQGGS
jgi:hypothetical protein